MLLYCHNVLLVKHFSIILALSCILKQFTQLSAPINTFFLGNDNKFLIAANTMVAAKLEPLTLVTSSKIISKDLSRWVSIIDTTSLLMLFLRVKVSMFVRRIVDKGYLVNYGICSYSIRSNSLLMEDGSVNEEVFGWLMGSLRFYLCQAPITLIFYKEYSSKRASCTECKSITCLKY